MEDIIDIEKNTPSVEKKTNSKFVEVEPKKIVKEKVNTESNSESYFDGSFFELWAYTYLLGILSTISLGIAVPWAICLYKRYLYSHTVISGKRLQFDGKGDQLFTKYFKWMFFNTITFGIYSIWMPTRFKEWELSNLHFEDEKNVPGESYFTGSVGGYFGIRLLCSLITCITFGLLAPVAEIIKYKWELQHYVINRKVVIFKGTAGAYFIKRFLWGLLTCVTFGIYGLWVPIKSLRWKISRAFLAKEGEVNTKEYNEVASAGSSKGMNKAVLFIIIGVVAIAVIFGIVKLISIFGPAKDENVTEVYDTVTAFKQEVVKKGYNGFPDDIHPDGSNKYYKVEELGYESLNEYNKNGGKVTYSGYSIHYNYNGNPTEMKIDLKFKKGTTYCTLRFSTDYYYDNMPECTSLKDEIFKRLNIGGSGHSYNKNYVEPSYYEEY